MEGAKWDTGEEDMVSYNRLVGMCQRSYARRLQDSANRWKAQVVQMGMCTQHLEERQRRMIVVEAAAAAEEEEEELGVERSQAQLPLVSSAMRNNGLDTVVHTNESIPLDTGKLVCGNTLEGRWKHRYECKKKGILEKSARVLL